MAKRRKTECGKPCTVHIAKDPGYLGLQPMSMGITTWIRRNTCMYAAAILPVIHTLGHTKSMRPMGTMADSNLRNKRIEAQQSFGCNLEKWLYDQTQHIYLASEPFESPGKGHTYREIFLLPV